MSTVPDDASSPAQQTSGASSEAPDTLDSALADLEARARALAAQKTQLTAQLRSLKAQVAAAPQRSPEASGDAVSSLSSSATVPDNDARILAFALSRSQALNRHSLSRLHRISGITTFSVRDPSDQQKLLGIRIEVFSNGQFSKPHYILLSLQTGKRGAYFCVARHSIPAFLGLGQLANELLPAGGVQQQLEEFVRRLRARVVRHRRRLAAAEAAKQAASKAGRIGDVMEEWTRRVESVEWDLPVELVTVRWMNGTQALLRVEEDGQLKRVVVKDRKGRRKADIETRVQGSLSRLPDRIGWD